MLSRTIRPCASSRSSGLSQRVVLGVSGRRTKPARATAKVITPSRMKSLFDTKISFQTRVLGVCKDLPSPPRKSSYTIQPFKDSRCNERRESSRRDLSKVQTRNPRCNLLPRIENTQHIRRPRIERRLCNPKQESTDHQAGIVLYQSRAS